MSAFSVNLQFLSKDLAHVNWRKFCNTEVQVGFSIILKPHEQGPLFLSLIKGYNS